ncbi:hypothetical protein TD95_002884 [Thielaviopsis punctulata]|uniref:NADP-dependent oxidoreductase domain-containing protein n=1 Tax=Thielaviopsis punctulata TaxID=72032 RepID=A0A0F4ZDB3_9PEZI|nr:hypothetical protein TD95_002884 [Thielaviopsis punctulata]
MSVPKTFRLNSGQDIPVLGYGTWQGPAAEITAGVKTALATGYRLVDCAYVYGNEEAVGKGLAEAFAEGIVRREDIFVITKVWCTYQSSKERVLLGLEKSLKALGLEYVDMLLVHWPVVMNPEGNHELFPKLPDGRRDILQDHSHLTTWKHMEAALATGKTRAIGVSNYSQKYLQELLPTVTVVPAVNQIENHPSLPQQEVVDECKKHGIRVIAYSPFGSTGGPMFSAEPVKRVAAKHGKSPATILLSWNVARGSTVLAKSVTPQRIKDNFDLVALSEEDMAELTAYSDSLAGAGKLQRYVYPEFGVDFGFPDKSA